MSSFVASTFLTRPFLFLGINPTVVTAVQNFVQDFFTVTGGDSHELDLHPIDKLPSLSEIASNCNADGHALIEAYFGPVKAAGKSTKLALPAPLALACHLYKINWNDWLLSLGGSSFKLVIKPSFVYVVKKSDGCVGVVWTNPHIHTARSTSPTLSSAVDRSDADSEDNDTSNSSRPSSRSSNYSAFSFSSHSSTSSQSSIASTTSFVTKPTLAAATPTQASFTASIATRSRPALTSITNNTLPVSAPMKASPAPTKYLYHGGVSTVLTGGVMLGAAPRKPQHQPQMTTPGSCAPSPVYTAPHRAFSTKLRDPSGPSSIGAWRRSPPIAV